MIKTRQISLRLPTYHINLVKAFQEEKGLNSFTTAVKEIILGHQKTRQRQCTVERFILKLENILKASTPTRKKRESDNQEILNNLNELESAIHLIIKCLYIIGASDVRTSGEIEELFMEKR